MHVQHHPSSSAYGEYIFQLIQYSRYGRSYHDFVDKLTRVQLPTGKLLNQWLLVAMMKLLLRKFYGREYDLVNSYGISVSQMTTDMFLLVVITVRYCHHSLFITGSVTRATRRMSLVEHDLFIHPGVPTCSPQLLVGHLLLSC